MLPEKHRSDKVRQSAKDMTCALRIPGVCQGRRETVVWCHSPYLEDGKGTGTKSHDILGCYGCADCHDVLDGRRTVKGIGGPDIWELFHRALKRSLIMMWQAGVRPW